ncbi:enoyl-CoA hydratase-related protein [Agrobacterium vitis]|uniref:enoyl-CoA hydratase-related protein n=1 Tax=Agrobacterium vitis TaxID=373 RepID=UPI001573AFF7|nr:enoyl-CoA hydratase-related protein [Agrobacterium vitis]NSZ20274.1 enoyl-CoA hydratase [Agrobacterium vitis]QZO07614.1 enoyl-CoA hydratase/isomerase family protein [Agrobacterium vitis]UJL90809.1 enoyl-CoA hydratase/isomerase family protein [Agrobacterium vitis]
MTTSIEISREDRVAVIRFNRPAQLNALNAQLAAEIVAAVETLDADKNVGALVITGSERAFAAGADIAEMVGKSAEQMIEENFFGIWDRFANSRLPKIAAVNGYALGGGCELMMMCDFAIAGENAKFGQPEIKLGVIAGMGGTQRMTKQIGRALSMDLHLTGRMMGAQEALRAGLVARVVPDAEVVATAMDAAAEIAGYSRPATRLAREAVMKAEELSLHEGILYERALFHRLFGTHDQREGMTAFVEKRPPNFQGNR